MGSLHKCDNKGGPRVDSHVEVEGLSRLQQMQDSQDPLCSRTLPTPPRPPSSIRLFDQCPARASDASHAGKLRHFWFSTLASLTQAAHAGKRNTAAPGKTRR